MKKIWIVLGILTAFTAAARAETIVSHETEKYFYQNGEMKRYEGQFENTYQFDPEKNTLVRTRVYDYQTKKIYPDETVYTVQAQLDSNPANAAQHGLPPVIKAYGQPDGDSAEIVTIDSEFVHSLKSTGSQIVVSRGRRLR